MRPSTMARVALGVILLAFMSLPIMLFASIGKLAPLLICFALAAVMALVIKVLLDASYGDYDR